MDNYDNIRVFSHRHLARMEVIMRAVCKDFDVELLELTGEANHGHLVVNVPPKVALSRPGQLAEKVCPVRS